MGPKKCYSRTKNITNLNGKQLASNYLLIYLLYFFLFAFMYLSTVLFITHFSYVLSLLAYIFFNLLYSCVCMCALFLIKFHFDIFILIANAKCKSSIMLIEMTTLRTIMVCCFFFATFSGKFKIPMKYFVVQNWFVENGCIFFSRRFNVENDKLFVISSEQK